MSKLGNVYELDFNTRMKNKYPVVYINDGYIVCKCNGTDPPVTFFRNNGSGYTYGAVLDYAIFKAMNNPLEHRSCYNIYVPHGVNESFSEFFELSENQRQLKKAKKNLETAEYNLSCIKAQLNRVQEKYINARVSIDRIYKLQYLIDELVSLYGNPPSNNLRFDSLVWCSDKALITKDSTIDEITDSLANGIWYCVPESGFDGRYFLSEESQDTLNNLREFGELEEIVNADNE